MGKARSVLFSVVCGLLGMSLVAAAVLSIAGSQVFPLDQAILGANAPMAVLTLGIGFLVAAAERAMQNTFTRLAIIYAVASVVYQFTAGASLGNHTFMQAIVIPVVGAVLLIFLHPDPKAIVPMAGGGMKQAGSAT